jgi:peptidoglycan hydrolase CwlO-like protein
MQKLVYIIFNATVIIVSLIGLQVLMAGPAGAQDASLSPATLSTNLVDWLKTGMSVVFILTLLFGAHNMYLHNKFTGFKEQTVLIIKQEFDPKIKELKDNMITKEQFNASNELHREVLVRIEEKVDDSNKKLDKASERMEHTANKLEEFNRDMRNREDKRNNP